MKKVKNGFKEHSSCRRIRSFPGRNGHVTSEEMWCPRVRRELFDDGLRKAGKTRCHPC